MEPTTALRRQEWMGLLARAPAARLAVLMPPLPPHEVLRAPEIGTVMVQGRIGGTGQPFNLGEMTVTRASVRLDTGEVGHGYVQGRDRRQSLHAALADAILQGAGAQELARAVLVPLAADEAQAESARAAAAAATRVEFFTLARGDDP